MSEHENLKPFFKHTGLLRRWFELICIANPQIKMSLNPRLSSQHLNLELVSLGFVQEIRRNGNANILIEGAKDLAKGLWRKREYTLPARMVYRAPHCQITLYAPHTTPKGKAIAGRITVELYAGTLPHEKTEGLQLTLTFDELFGNDYRGRKPALSVTKTIDAIGTEDVASMLRLKDLLDVLYAEEGTRLMAKHIFETVHASYAPNDQWSTDLKRLATITNQPVPENNQ